MKYKAFKYRLYPDEKQVEMLAKTFGCVRFVWNNKVDAFNTEGLEEKTTTVLRKEFPFLADVSAATLQQKEIDFKAFKKNFFSKTRKKKIGRPQFKKRSDNQSFRLPGQKFKLLNHKVKLEKIGSISAIIDRRPPKKSYPVSVTIAKNKCGQYFASILVRIEDVKTTTSQNKVGIDLGITHFATLSTGEKFESPSFFRKNQAKLMKAQKNLSRKKINSKRRVKARMKVAKIHLDIANQRNYFLHNLSRSICNQYGFIAIEDLNIDGMVKNRKLSKSISDAGWAKFISMLEYKVVGTVQKVGRFFASSKLCNHCGKRNETLKLSDRICRCSKCNNVYDRDINASKNILEEAIKLFAQGVTCA